MATNTPYLKLYKVNTEQDGDSNFNIDTMLNNNWDKIDNAMEGVNSQLSEFAKKNHNHDTIYSPLSHNHDRISGETNIEITLNGGQVYTIQPYTTNLTGKKYFEIILQGNASDGSNINLGAMVHGRTGKVNGYHMCIGSLAVFPSGDVRDRYTSAGAWFSPGIDENNYDHVIHNPAVGTSYIPSISYRGCGIYQNTFTSCTSDDKTYSHYMKLLGVHINDKLNLVFKNDHPSVSVKLKSRIRWEVW